MDVELLVRGYWGDWGLCPNKQSLHLSKNVNILIVSSESWEHLNYLPLIYLPESISPHEVEKRSDLAALYISHILVISSLVREFSNSFTADLSASQLYSSALVHFHTIKLIPQLLCEPLHGQTLPS